MIPLQFRTEAEVDSPAELRDQLKTHGGQVILYRYVVSAIVISHSDFRAVWIAPGRNRRQAMLLHSLPTMVCGWWSLHGVFWTVQALAHNINGGVDISEMLLKFEGSSNVPIKLQIPASSLAEQKKAKRISDVVLVAFTCIFLVWLFYVTRGNRR